MKIKIFMSLLSFFSLHLVHDCQAGGFLSTEKPEEKKTVTQTSTTQTQPRQQNDLRDDAQQKGAIIPYYFFKYNYNNNDDKAIVEIPYPKSAKLSMDLENGSTFSNEIYQIWIMNEEMKGKNTRAQELEQNKELEPKTKEEVSQWFKKIPEDMSSIGQQLKGFDAVAEESLKTVRKHAETLNLEKIWQTVRLKRNRASLESHLFFKMEDNTYIMFHVLPLPELLWRKL